MKVLLHICCGPCAIYCVNAIRRKDNIAEGFFYNPNIHPAREYEKRKEAAIIVSEKLNMAVRFHPALSISQNFLGGRKGGVHREHISDDFFKAIERNEEKSKRCHLCWQLRLKQTAEFAKKENYDAFTTTLLISPYQNHDEIKNIANTLSQEYKINFYYEDFRPGFKESHALARDMGLYHQKYCGCSYSERERMIKK